MIWAEKYKYKIVILIIFLLSVAILVESQLEHEQGQDYGSIQSPPIASKPKVKAASSEISDESIIVSPSTWPEFNYSVPLGKGYSLRVNLNIEAIKEPPPGAYWCGAPFYLDYEGEAQAMITNQAGEVIDELELTSPSLILGISPNYDFYYYQLYDLDGDGQKNEFIVLTYFSCNGNWVRVVKVDKKKYKFSTIPFQLSEEIIEKIVVDPHKKDLIFNNGKIIKNSYDMFEGVVYTSTFVYQKGVFMQVDRKVLK